MAYQTTIRDQVMCAGIGVHSARSATLRLKPAPAEFGIAFVRTDLDASAEPILATARSVTDTMLGTTIGNARGDTVATIEHLMAAF
ncbi:MAG: UDP-3-O-acyl-N-acetylglucosamine deacetylase, partial [Pseudomonadota bacterium]